MERLALVVMLSVSPLTFAEDFHITGLSTCETLNEFSRQANTQILYDFARISARHVNDLIGAMTSEEGIAVILEGSGLRVDMINEHTMAILPIEIEVEMVSSEVLVKWLDEFDNVAMSYPYASNVRPSVRVTSEMPDAEEYVCVTCGNNQPTTIQPQPIRLASNDAALTAASLRH